MTETTPSSPPARSIPKGAGNVWTDIGPVLAFVIVFNVMQNFADETGPFSKETAIFWATGHLLANGDMASIILFGGFLVYAILHIIIGTANGVRPSPVVRDGHNLLSVLAGIALYGVMTQLHMALIGVPVFQLPLPG